MSFLIASGHVQVDAKTDRAEAKGLGVDESVMWGDYWFLDTIAAVDAARTAH